MYLKKKARCLFFICLLQPFLLQSAAAKDWNHFALELQTQQPAISKQVGAIKTIDAKANTITLTSDSGAVIEIAIQDSTKLLRVEPGQTDLKSATPIQFSDLQVGDRVLVQGKDPGDAKSIAALRIIVMKHSDVEAKQAKEREDWQKRSVGGLVSAVDPAAGTVSISVMATGGSKTIAIHTTDKTVFRRYATGSVKFDDAKPSALDEVKPGNQLRALGTRSADGNEVAAEQIVSGAFRNIAGTVISIDASANSITVMDLATKKPVVVEISSQSQLRKLSPMAAQFIAMRLKGGSPGATGGGSQGKPAEAPNSPPGGSAQGGGQHDGQSHANGASGNTPAGRGQADMQQALSRMPPVSIRDFQKGDAVMVVSTEGATSNGVTAITLVGGVEPILTASSSPAMMLSPWSLGGGGMESAAGNQ